MRRQIFGAPDARLTVESEWRGDGPAPDLTHLPEIASRTGVDLHPVDVLDPEQRRWLRALVWPEDRPAADLLDARSRWLQSDRPSMRMATRL